MTEYIVRPRQLVAHLSARTLLSPAPVFGRAIGKGFAGENFLVGHPVLGSPALAAGGAASALDPAAAAWVAAVVTAGGSVSGSAASGRQKLVNDLVVGLKADGIWAKLDRLYLFAAENTQSALVDLVARVQATETNAPTFAVDTGYTVNGTTLVGLNYNPTIDAVHFGLNDCHLGCWNLFNGTQANPLITDNPSTTLMIYPKYADGKLYTRLQDSWNGLDIGDPRGWLTGDRSSSTGRDTYQNGSLFGNVFTGGSSAVHNAPTVLFSGGPCCAVSIGGSLTSANHLALYNRLRTYMTAVGVVAGGALDPAAAAWVAAVVTAGGSVSGSATSGRQKLVNDLVVGLKADGIWAKLDRLWVFAAENSNSALIDLKALVQATTINAPTFTPDRGYAGNGSTSYINSNFNASTSGVGWTLNSAHIAGWSNTNRANAPTVISGAYDGSNVSDLMPFYGSGIVTRINGGGLPALANSTSIGFFIGQRNNSSEVEGFYNGVSVGTVGNAAGSVINLPFYICGRNDGGGPSSLMSDQICMISYGAAFTSTQSAGFYNRLRTYMTGVGVP